MTTKKSKKKKMTEREWDLFLDKVIDWSSKGDPKKLVFWKKIVSTYLRNWGWNTKAIKDFYSWGEGGGFNNKLLHVKSTIEDFYGEVGYCSDRMSLDRLFRCHTMFRTINLRVLLEKCPDVLTKETREYLIDYPNADVD